MSNIPPNPYVNTPGAPSTTNPGTQVFNHSQQFRQVPSTQLPPGYGGVKQDVNFNSAQESSVVPNSAVGHFNNYSQSASSSPAFNQPGVHSPQVAQLSPQKVPLKPISQSTSVHQYQSSAPINYASATISTVSSPNPYPPSFPPQQRQVNNNAPLLISSQQHRPLFNGPPIPRQEQIQTTLQPAVAPINTLQQSLPSSLPYSAGLALSAPSRNSPLLPGPPLSGLSANGPPPSNVSLGSQLGVNGSGNTRQLTNPPVSGMQYTSYNGPTGFGKPTIPPSGLPSMSGPQSLSSAPSLVPQSIPSLGPQKTSNVSNTLPTSMPTPPSMTMASSSVPPQYSNTPIGQQNISSTAPGLPSGPLNIPSGPPSMPLHPSRMAPPSQSGSSVPPNMPSGPTSLPTGPLLQHPSLPNMPPSQSGLQTSNLQNRYPQMAPSSYANYQSQPQKGAGRLYPQQQNTHELTQQMGQLSVTKQGFDQLWGHEMVDLLQCRNVLPEYPEDPPEIRLTHQFVDSPNCSSEIFRCTINRIPETNSLLQKSRLPLGILIHPFKDLNHLPVIQCNTIVRCRACRTYINPFVYFVDSKRWKCNLCYRVNDLPEEFQYDPVSKSYGDPSRRPEIKSATIEFIAPGEYMLRPPQPAVYLFLLDVSHIARDSGYLQVFCDTLKNNLEQLPGDARMQVGFICYDSHVHYYLMSDGLTRPKEMTVLDIDDVFLPSPEALLVNLGERREMVQELLTILPQRYSSPGVPSSALGAALQAAYKLMAPTGGRITVFQTCLPNIGPGALQSREDPNARSSKEVNHLNPATDFYKRMALDCSGAQISVDLFLLSSQYSDLASLSGMSKFSAGTVYHIPIFRASRSWQADQFRRMFTRYLTRKIGFEAVMRVRCTRGIAIHTFHGNFFVRSTDLLSLPNVSPDAGFGMQLSIEESLSDLQHVCFQAALLYTSSKGERRIRVHTLALPIATTLPDVLHAADQQCIIGLLSKMAVDRAASASMSEAREALTNVAIDALSAHRLARNLPAGAASNMLQAPMSLRLLPLYLSALLKRKAFRTGTSTRLDERVADMCDLKTQPLSQLLRGVYPDLYPIHSLREYLPRAEEEDDVPDPPRMHLTAERINLNGAYLLDDGENMIIYVCQAVSPAFLSEIFGVTAFSQLPDEARSLPQQQTEGNALLHAFIEKLNDDRPYPSNILILRDNSPSRQLFTERLVDDRVESAFSYYEFLQHIKDQVK